MLYFKRFESFTTLDETALIEKAKTLDNIKEFAALFPHEFPGSKVSETLFHGTDRELEGFAFDPDYERETHPYDFDLPDGRIFLTNDIKEAACYGKYVVPVDVNARDILTFEVTGINPSQQFDEDYTYGGIGMYQSWEESTCDVLEVKGYKKSTFVTYPEIVKPKPYIAQLWYKAHPKKY